MIRGVLLDLSGVLYSGGSALPGAPRAVARLREAGLPVRYLTNTTSKPKRVLLERLSEMGFEAEAGHVLTPAQMACERLCEAGHVPHLLVAPALEEDFAGCPDEGPPAVVVGDMGRGFTYDVLNPAFRLLTDGAPLLALAANRSFRDADGELSMDAGAFVAALEYASGTEAELLGKPSADFFARAAASMGCDLGAVAMVGDDAEADVSGALSAGAGMGVLVRTGKYREGAEDAVSPRPTAVADDIAAAVERILAKAG